MSDTPPTITGSSGAAAPNGGGVPTSEINLSYDPADRCVYALLTPAPVARALSLESLRQQLADAGFGRYHAPDEFLDPIVRKANSGELGRFAIAQQRDAQLHWKVADNRQTVHLTVVPACGGAAPEHTQLRAALQAMGVPALCILDVALEEVCALGQADNVCVAQARLAQDGEDTRFEVLVQGCLALQPVVTDDGRVDMHQLHDFVVVEVGTPLMRAHPATPGVPGMDVSGQILPPKPGRELAFSAEAEGAQVAERDPGLLVAAIKGHPVLVSRGVRVDPTLRLPQVDLSSGNVDFDGSVEVTGDIASGFVVRATGDILVRGSVEKAVVSARRNLIILGGVLGEDQGRDQAGELILRTRLSAGGDLQAKFISLAEVVARGDIRVREYVLQSHLKARGAVFLGQDGGRGSVIGGRTQAGHCVAANILGSDAHVATDIRVGRPHRNRRLLEQLQKARQLAEHNCRQLRQIQDQAEGGRAGFAPDKLARVEQTLVAQEARVERLRRLIRRLVERHRVGQQSCILIKRRVFANVTLTLEGVVQTLGSDLGPRRLVRVGAELVAREL